MIEVMCCSDLRSERSMILDANINCPSKQHILPFTASPNIAARHTPAVDS